MSLQSFFQNLLVMLQTILPIAGGVALVGGGLMVALHMAHLHTVGRILGGLVIAYAAIQIIAQVFI